MNLFNRNKKIQHLGLLFIINKIATKLDDLLSVKVHAMFADIDKNLEKSISAIETNNFQEVRKLNDIQWDSDFLYLVSCEFLNEKLILIYRQPYEYLYDETSFLYDSKLTEEQYSSLCKIVEPFSNYLFYKGKLTKAFTINGEDLFEKYDFSSLI